jgi:hypothetical protein
MRPPFCTRVSPSAARCRLTAWFRPKSLSLGSLALHGRIILAQAERAGSGLPELVPLLAMM